MEAKNRSPMQPDLRQEVITLHSTPRNGTPTDAFTVHSHFTPQTLWCFLSNLNPWALRTWILPQAL